MPLKPGDTVFFHALGQIGFGTFIEYHDHYLKYRIYIDTQIVESDQLGYRVTYKVTVAEEELISEAKYRLLVLAGEQQFGVENI